MKLQALWLGEKSEDSKSYKKIIYVVWLQSKCIQNFEKLQKDGKD